MKRILASVFLALAVVAAVGIFGVQTSNQAAGQANTAVSISTTVNGGDGVPDVTVAVGRSITIDLKDYVNTPGTTASTTTYHLVAQEYSSETHIYNPANPSTMNNQKRWRDSRVDVTLTGSKVTITGRSNNPDGQAWRVHWVADNTPGNNSLTDATTYDTWDTSGTTTKDEFDLTVVDAPTGTPELPATAVLAGGASSDDPDQPGDSVTWTIPGIASPYVVLAPSSNTAIAETSVSGGAITIMPKRQGTVTIGPILVVNEFFEDNPEDSTDGWTIPAQQFTVHYAEEAPEIDLKANSVADPDVFDKDGSEGNEAVFTIRHNHNGEIGKFRSTTGSDRLYTNRNLGFLLANGNNVAHFRISRAAVDTDGEAVEATLSTRPRAAGVDLPLGTYTFKVNLVDQVEGSAGPPRVEAGASGTLDVTVNVIQGNQDPVVLDIPALTISENTATGIDNPLAKIIDLDDYASDPDGQDLEFDLVDKAGQTPAENLVSGGKVSIHAGTNELRLIDEVDYEDVDDDGETEDEDTAAEQPAGYDRDAVRWRGTLTVSDGLVTVEKKITIAVSDADDAATARVALNFDLPEDAELDDFVGVIGQSGETWTDVEFNDTFGVDNDYFKLVEGSDLATKPAGVTDATEGILLVGVLGGDDGDDATAGDNVAVKFNFEGNKTVFNIAVDAEASGQTPSARGSAVRITITNVDEAPHFTKVTSTTDSTLIRDDATTALPMLLVDETALVGDPVGTAPDDGTAVTAAPITAADEDAGEDPVFSLVTSVTDGAAYSGPFTIHSSTGQITVRDTNGDGIGDLDFETAPTHTFAVQIADADDTTIDPVRRALTIRVRGANEAPVFAANSTVHKKIDETTPTTTPIGTEIATYTATDGDNDIKVFAIRDADDARFFEMDSTPARGILKTKAALDFDSDSYPDGGFAVEIKVEDAAGLTDELRVVIELNNLNDNAPVWQDGYTAATPVNHQLSVNENTLRGHLLATYTATDLDGDPITYTLSGPNGSSYQIGSADGMLKTLAALDAETNASDSVVVTATDNSSDDSTPSRSTARNATIAINGVDDRIGSITVKMANPVIGTHGDPNTALADRKITLSNAVPEAPTDLPATRGAANESVPIEKFVETSAARWGSVLRIEVLAESPDNSTQSAGGERCGNGNQCVVITLEGDDSDDVLKVMAFRNSEKDNLFVAAVMPVASANMATPGTAAVYKHSDNGVPRIQVDEEDTLRIKFGNLRDSVTIDNEAPEFSNFLPEHEASIDDDEVQYTFTVTDAISGIPEPEDLPDSDGDENYMAVAVLVHNAQCHNIAANAAAPSGTTRVPDTNLYEGAQIYCPQGPGNTSPDPRGIADDKDLDSVTDGYEVDTEVVLSNNQISFVTFIACDAAGNCVAFDPDENDTREALAEITVDTTKPALSQARTGVMWDAADNKYDDSRSFIQAIFTDLSKLNPDTIEADDFVVDGYTIKRVYWYDDPDTEDQNWTTRYDSGSGSRAYREISKTVFIELEEELLPDATPDVSVVPNGLEDEAGNEQDDDEVEADDWIAPKFAVQSITSPRETSRDNVLVGEDEKVTITVTSDERISTTKPLVDVNAVNAPAGCVDRSGIILRAGRDTDGDGRLEPGEQRADCAMSAKGSPLNSVISKDGTNEWTITVDKPSTTGYYNVYIYADDRSSQNNRGSEGVDPDNITVDFFEKDGDVNSDDAVFFEGDVQLPKPQVVVSGEDAGDTEPTVEFKRPLFIEVDFTEPFSADCSEGDKLSNKLECTAETAEYAEDGFDAVTITRFELDGVDMTDDVKTTDNETFLVALDDVGIGDHELKIQATDLAGNELKDVLEIEFEVEERDPFTRRLNPGWNLVSLPGSPADSAIASVFSSDIEVRTVYTYNPVTPGGWQVAVRETLDDAWQGDLTDITAKSGYWVLSDAIQDLEVSIPRLAGGAVGASTPVQPPVIPMYAGWNLIPVVDVTGDALDTKKSINATTYLNSLDDGLDLARVLGFNTITNEWFTVIDPSDASVTDNLQIGSAYWVFVRESASLVPGGIPR